MSCLKNRILLDGSSQLNRFPESIAEGYINIDDLTEENYYDYLVRISREIIFYNLNHLPEGYWNSFFPQRFNEFLSTIGKKPHLALLEVFIKIYIAAIQKDLNKIPGKHLEYFYKNILGFVRTPARPDKVLLYFELNQAAGQALLEAGTQITGIDPVSGYKVVYETDNEVILNRAEVARYQTLFAGKENGTIYTAAIANSADGNGQPIPAGNPYWPAFGESQREKTIADRTMQDSRIGFALSSPLFFLIEGTRNIVVKLTLDGAVPFSKSHFRVWFTGKGGWHGPYVPLISSSLLLNGNSKMIFTINLPASAPPVVTADSALHDFETNDPLIFIEIDPSVQQSPFDILFAFNEKNLVVEEYSVEVEVNGIKNNCIIENGSSVVPNKPFPLFGPVPVRGSTFTIRCAEMASKNINELSVFFDWLDFQFYFNEYYKEYQFLGSVSINYTNYKLDVRARLHKNWNTKREISLFAKDISSPVNKFFPLTLLPANSSVPAPADFAPGYSDEILEGTLIVTKGPLIAFGHQEFSKVLTKQVLDIALQVGGAAVPNPPYTPTVKEFKLGYKADDIAGNASLRFYQVLPFGVKEMKGRGFNLFPVYNETGCLYIGLQNLTPGQALNLLFEFSDSANQSIDEEEDFQLQWQYLSHNEWKNLPPEQVTNDSTDNWRQSGIVSLQVPFDISMDNTVAEAGIYWISACLLSVNTAGRKLSVIRTQTVSATFKSSDELQKNWNGAVPANTLQKMTATNTSIKKVVQPLPSFNGYSSEGDSTFFARINERLRHKNRAVQYWDYERLVLKQFPEIFKVKCLFHTQKMNERSPGAITLIIIPYVSHGLLQDRLEPQPAPFLLRKVKELVGTLTSPWVEVNAAGPVYEQILLDFKVRFIPGFDPSFYRTKLEEDIYKFLTPWASAEGKDIVFENRIHRSAIIYFIEKLPYVNFITNLNMYHAYNGPSLFGIGCMEIETDFIVMDPPVPALGDMIIEDDFIIGFETDLAVATTSRSILVSALHHRIEVLSSDNAHCAGAQGTGIGAMAIERDFIIGTPC